MVYIWRGIADFIFSVEFKKTKWKVKNCSGIELNS
jgi:hypothetical protein